MHFSPAYNTPLYLWLALLFKVESVLKPVAVASSANTDLSQSDDHALMQQVARGEDSAFRTLFDKWKRPLIAYFFRAVGDYATAEDLTLEVAAKIYRAAQRYEPRAKFSTWLFQVAFNHLRDWRRRSVRAPRFTPADSAPEWQYAEADPSANPALLREWEEWLQAALAQLPDHERSALLLVAQQGLQPREAADSMGLTPNHLRVLLSKARAHLRKFREA